MFLKLFTNFPVDLPNIGWVQVSSRNWDANEYQINLNAKQNTSFGVFYEAQLNVIHLVQM